MRIKPRHFSALTLSSLLETSSFPLQVSWIFPLFENQRPVFQELVNIFTFLMPDGRQWVVALGTSETNVTAWQTPKHLFL